MRSVFSIAIDGPAGAGKSTVAKAVAAEMGAVYLDTGAMYRAIGLYMNRHGITGAGSVARALPDTQLGIRFIDGVQHMFLGTEDVTEAIRLPEVSMLASRYSAIAEVRTYLVERQRAFAKENSVVMDGRDIGTDVLPDATLKIFLTASCEVRARRRFLELREKGKDEPYEKVLSEIVERDYTDAHREVSPMRQAADAVLVNTSELTQDEVVAKVLELARAAVAD